MMPPEYASCDINIQWKNTDLCIDFHCSCIPADQTYAAHFDGYFGDHLECSNCGARYILPQGLTLRAINEGRIVNAYWKKPEIDDEILRDKHN